MAPTQLHHDAQASLEQAIEFSFDNQQPDGHWFAEVSADVTFTSQYVMFKYAMGFDLKGDADALRRWLLQDQTEDGSWALAPKNPGHISTTVEAYLALKILGVSADDPAMLKARDFTIKNGGVAKVRFFTRFFLATFGLVPWSAIPQLPAEFILMPPSSPINIYVLSSWARSTLIPVLIVRHHEPVYPLPNGLSPNNDFLDELWCDPDNKNIPFGPPLSDCLWERDFIRFGFTAIDKIIAQLGGLKQSPLRGLARRKCVEWLLTHQESTGDWAGFFPPMHGSVWALILEGFPMDHEAVRLGLEALERLSVTGARGKRLASTISPLWDTGLMLNALCDAGVGGEARVQKAVKWVKKLQLLGPQGDWRIYRPNIPAGGWSFQYSNTWYPDVDDTAVVVMALIKQDPNFIGSQCISNAIKWIIGMQNHDGGWAAFDYGNNKLWLHKIPFSDMDSLCDPSTADVTGRILECFGLLLSHRKSSWDRKLMLQVKRVSERGIDYLLSKQEACGAWWGRWGSNYNYGTGNVLRGLVHFAYGNTEVQKSIERATRWFESVQNTDGGWGEDLRSYDFPDMAGQGESTAAHTAWALLSLQLYRSHSDSAIERGILWLISNQRIKSEQGASWPTDLYTGTGFPKVLYLGYPYYHHYFPIMALSKYVQENEKASFQAVVLPTHITEPLNRPDILLMVIGSRGDIQAFLNIAILLTNAYNYRVRIATHPLHRTLVEREGIEFYSVGGNPREFAMALTEKPNVLISALRGELRSLRQSINIMIGRYWRSSIDNNTSIDSAEKLSRRPFLADSIVSSLPTLAHIHCAEKLEVPLVLVSVQPLLPTSEFPHVLTLTKPKFSSGLRWNYISFFCMELLNWLACGSHLNYLRTKEYGMKPASWTWAVYDFLKMKIPHVCLWSPHVLSRPSEWGANVTIAGYAFNRETRYLPPKALESFLETDKPVLAIGFGSASISDPVKLMTEIFTAVGNVGAKAVICMNWSKISNIIPIPEHIFLIDEVPHEWLLPQVQGFVHHGGAGHTAAGLKSGIPMLIIPFFLDQNFWAAKVQQLELGPPPLRHRDISALKLAASLKDLLSYKYQRRCKEMAFQISSDKDGAETAAETVACVQNSTERGLPCSIILGLNAHWQHINSGLRLSGAAAACLTSHNILDWSDLSLVHGINWSNQRLDGASRFAEMLNKLTDMLCDLVRIIYSLLRWCIGAWDINDDVEDDYAVRMRDPVLQARITQGQYDLQFITGEAIKTEDGRSMEDQIIRNWRALSTAEFHHKFRKG